MQKLNQSIAHIRIPERMKRLPLSERGYPVPWFVAWLTPDGKRAEPGTGTADFRIVDTPKVAQAHNRHLCWLCGQTLGQFKTFVVGPMCLVNMTSAELPSHLECSAYSVRACPFLSKPAMRRNDNGKDAFVRPAGDMLERNPGVTLLLTTKSYRPFSDGNGGVLFEMGEPVALDWYREGRKATRAEVLASVDSGMPHLVAGARTEGKKALDDLEARYQRVMKQLPPELGESTNDRLADRGL